MKFSPGAFSIPSLLLCVECLAIRWEASWNSVLAPGTVLQVESAYFSGRYWFEHVVLWITSSWLSRSASSQVVGLRLEHASNVAVYHGALRAECRIWTCEYAQMAIRITAPRNGSGGALVFFTISLATILSSSTFRQPSSNTCLGCVIGRDSRPRLTGVHHSASVRLKYLATLKYPGRY